MYGREQFDLPFSHPETHSERPEGLDHDDVELVEEVEGEGDWLASTPPETVLEPTGMADERFLAGETARLIKYNAHSQTVQLERLSADRQRNHGVVLLKPEEARAFFRVPQARSQPARIQNRERASVPPLDQPVTRHQSVRKSAPRRRPRSGYPDRQSAAAHDSTWAA